jgi:hypothetical protein
VKNYRLKWSIDPEKSHEQPPAVVHVEMNCDIAKPARIEFLVGTSRQTLTKVRGILSILNISSRAEVADAR